LRAAVPLILVLLVLAACRSGGAPHLPASGSAVAATPGTGGTSAATVPTPAHTVVVVMENHSYDQVIGNPAAPYIGGLAREGAVFTHSFAVAHPSEPNYLALFSGSTQGITDDSCPVTFTAANLGADLLAGGKSFAGYAADLPAAGSSACSSGNYARKHVPWADFSNVPASANQPFTSFPAADYARLPAVSFVIPNLCDDMHDCDVATGDAWLRTRLGGYVTWAMAHDSLLILTWDENDGGQGNQILTIFAGQRVRPGTYPERITHYNVLRTIEDAYGLRRDDAAASAAPITDVWKH
jgi:acid phosphatase